MKAEWHSRLDLLLSLESATLILLSRTHNQALWAKANSRLQAIHDEIQQIEALYAPSIRRTSRRDEKVLRG